MGKPIRVVRKGYHWRRALFFAPASFYTIFMAEEKIIKKEQVFAGIMPGFLILTPTRLYFEYNAGFFKAKVKTLFDIPINEIVNVEAEKNHFSSTYVLKIHHQRDGKEYEEKCSKSGWSPFKGRVAFKVEENLFNDWVRQIEEARNGSYNKNSNLGQLNELEKLAELKEKGIVTKEEFEKKKKIILRL